MKHVSVLIVIIMSEESEVKSNKVINVVINWIIEKESVTFCNNDNRTTFL